MFKERAALPKLRFVAEDLACDGMPAMRVEAKPK